MKPQSIELHLTSVEQLFNTLDHAPFRERDLDAEAEQYIVSVAEEMDARLPLAINLHLPESSAKQKLTRHIAEALNHYFGYRSEQAARELRKLFRVGKRSLAIGLGVLGISVTVNQTVTTYLPNSNLGSLVAEGFFILGWVANWRPLEIFLYDWWPIKRKRDLLRRLAAAPVEVHFRPPGETE